MGPALETQEPCRWVRGLPGWLLCLARFVFWRHGRLQLMKGAFVLVILALEMVIQAEVKVGSFEGLGCRMEAAQMLMRFVGFLADRGLSTPLAVAVVVVVVLRSWGSLVVVGQTRLVAVFVVEPCCRPGRGLVVDWAVEPKFDHSRGWGH
jgi:hypothetical protein